MSQLLRARVELSWNQGGPGVCTYYLSGGVPSPLDWKNIADQANDELGDVWASFSPMLFSDVAWTASADYDVIDVDSGNILDQFTLDTAGASGLGTSSSATGSRGSQVYYRFLTDEFRNGRRLAGGTYMGPVSSEKLASGWGLSTEQMATFRNYWSALTSGPGPRLAVYHRPVKGASAGGFYGDVVNVRVMRKPASLRSRRD